MVVSICAILFFPGMFTYLVSKKKGQKISMTRQKLEIRSVLWLRGKKERGLKDGDLDRAEVMKEEEWGENRKMFLRCEF